jgi:hypothetical protein
MLKNKKIKKSLKAIEKEEPDFLRALEHAESLEGIFATNAATINSILETVSVENASQLQDADGEICESLMEFFEMKCRNSQERMPMIFGPKRV